jgi:bifunctional enzyme CysN/CysC/sulfate adenylyltransferase subunit 1
VPLVRDRTAESFRFPVQYVIRPHLDYRGFAGQIGSGVVRRGDEVMVLPSGRKSRVKSIDTFDGSLDEAAAPLSVTVRLEDEVDCSRGDMLVHPASPPRIERRFDAMLVWLSEKPLDAGRSLLVKHAAQTVPARLERVHHRTDLETLAAVESTGLQLNDIGRVTVRTSRPLLCDAYAKNRVTGAFILIDALSNNTVAAGMILDEGAPNGQDGAVRDSGPVSEVERHARMGQKGVALFVGADAEQARSVERALFDRGHAVMIVPAREIAKDPLIEVTVRAVLAGMVVIVSGAEEAARASIADRLGAGRIVDEKSGEAKATIDRASRLASLID